MKKLRINLQMFASTNQTTHYELSQYVGSDKPTYLGDYNGDMSKIDTGIYEAKNEADTNATNIGTLTNLTTDAKSSLVSAINEVDSHADSNAGDIGTLNTAVASNTAHIGTMANLETTEKTNLVGAINEVETNIEKFNLTSFNTLTVKSTQNIANVSIFNVTLATNSDNSIYKLYGYISFNHGTTIGNGVIVCDSPLRPSQEYTISNSIIALNIGGNTALMTNSIKIKTNGEIEISIFGDANSYTTATLPACIYFNKDFGDIPA